MKNDANDMPSPALRRGDTVDILHARIKDAIQSGLYAPGQRLIEADLTQEYGVSRGPLREALRRLGAEGVVQFVPNKGAQVRRFTKKEILDIFMIREVLEGAAARLATINLRASTDRDSHRRTLHEIVSGRDRNRSHFAAENHQLRKLIMTLADNPKLEALLHELQLPLVRMQIRGAVDQDYVDQSRAEHAAIAEAMLSGDAAAAERLMQNHLKSACARLMAIPGPFADDRAAS